MPAEERRRDVFSTFLQRHLRALYNFVQREIAYHVVMGDLGPDDVTAADVVAEVAARAERDFTKQPEGREIRGWLIHLALDQIEAEVDLSKRERERTVRLEEDITETPPTGAASTLGDEILDLYQPDEDLKLEEIIPHRSIPTPEEILESRELQQYIARTLSTLPRSWRRTFVLHHVEGLSVAEIARIMGRSRSEVERDLRHAREYLRQRLVEAGLTPHDDAAQAVFGTKADVDVPASLRRSLDEKVNTSEEVGAARADAP